MKVIGNIKINCFCIYFWFCFIRKKNTIQNILMDEGKGLIIEKLDIMNIFKSINIVDILENFINKDYWHFEMSNRCKEKLIYYNQMNKKINLRM